MFFFSRRDQFYIFWKRKYIKEYKFSLGAYRTRLMIEKCDQKVVKKESLVKNLFFKGFFLPVRYIVWCCSWNQGISYFIGSTKFIMRHFHFWLLFVLVAVFISLCHASSLSAGGYVKIFHTFFCLFCFSKKIFRISYRNNKIS